VSRLAVLPEFPERWPPDELLWRPERLPLEERCERPPEDFRDLFPLFCVGITVSFFGLRLRVDLS